MPTFCLSFETYDSYRDLITGDLYRFGMLGSREVPSPRGVRISAYFSNPRQLGKAEHALFDYPLLSPIFVTPVEDVDWNEKWRQSARPVFLAPKIWVSPPWRPPPSRSNDAWIRIEPRAAFGTGHHETTRLAARAIVRCCGPRSGVESMLDIGTGSGILCFVADICGVGHSLGIEIDRRCTTDLAENLGANPPLHRIDFFVGTTGVIRRETQFDLVVMNMILTESTPLLAAVGDLLRPNGHFVWSGILTEEHVNAVTAARETQFRLADHLVEREWWCGVFRREQLDQRS